MYKTKEGYLRETINWVRKLQHIRVWEEKYGPVPFGHHIHHKNGIRHDNRLKNLEVLKPLDHHRKHAGYRKTNSGVWLKRCNTCKKFLPLSQYYYQDQFKPHPKYECKECTKISTSLNRYKKRLATAKFQIENLTKRLKDRKNAR